MLNRGNLFLVPLGKHSGQSLKWLFNTLSLECAHLEELEAKFVGECLTVLRADYNSVLQVDFVGDKDASEIALILLTDAFVPLLEEMECILVLSLIHI